MLAAPSSPVSGFVFVVAVLATSTVLATSSVLATSTVLVAALAWASR